MAQSSQNAVSVGALAASRDLAAGRASSALRSYVNLTRPGVLVLVVVTGFPALFLGQAAVPGLAAGLAILAGIWLAAAASSALNAVLDRDLDARMTRTRKRPLPAGDLAPRAAVIAGALMAVASTALLGWQGSALAALISVATMAFYLGIYTAWLKRRTSLNTVVGSVAGAAAPLIADAAVDGQIGAAGLILFAMVFFWQPVHFWAIALYRRNEYAAAGVPMLPVVAGGRSTRRKMLLYGALLVPVTLLPAPLGLLGPLYWIPAAALGVWFLARLVGLVRLADNRAARGVFMASNVYLLLLNVAMVADLLAVGGKGAL